MAHGAFYLNVNHFIFSVAAEELEAAHAHRIQRIRAKLGFRCGKRELLQQRPRGNVLLQGPAEWHAEEAQEEVQRTAGWTAKWNGT